MNRTLSTPWKPTKAQLLAAHDKIVPDLVAKNLIVLFAGINPGLYTAAIGRRGTLASSWPATERSKTSGPRMRSLKHWYLRRHSTKEKRSPETR